MLNPFTRPISIKQALRPVLAIGALVGFSVLIGCAGTPTPIPLADSEAGKFYAQRCGACHTVPHPKRHSMEEWSMLLDLMQVRMAERGVPPLHGLERTRIEHYLQGHAR